MTKHIRKDLEKLFLIHDYPEQKYFIINYTPYENDKQVKILRRYKESTKEEKHNEMKKIRDGLFEKYGDLYKQERLKNDQKRKDDQKVWSKKHYGENKEKCLEQNRKWKEINPYKVQQHRMKRLEKNQERVLCPECKIDISRGCLKRHLKNIHKIA